MRKNDFILKMMKNYLVILDENAKEGIDYSATQGGFIFVKTLSDENKDIINIINEEKIDELRTLFSEDDDLIQKISKTIVEYTFYGVPKSDEFDTIRKVLEKVRLVKVLNLEEYQEFCNNLVRMDKALDSDIIKDLVTYLTLPLSEVKNKEVKILYIKEKIENNQFVNGYELIRFINYILTGTTLFINYKKEYANKEYDFKLVDDDIYWIEKILFNKGRILELAKYRNTYQDFFIHIKLWIKKMIKENPSKFSKMVTSINQILRKGKKIRQVNLSISFIKEYLGKSLDEQNKFFSTLSIKELFKFINYLKLEDYYISQGKKDYRIRNGKFFIKEYKNESFDLNESLFVPMTVLKQKLIEKFTVEKEGQIKDLSSENGISTLKYKEYEAPIFPYEWTTPLLLSDKRKSNGVYYGSGIKVEKGFRIGVIWETDSDLDLSILDLKGNTFSWNTRWGNSDSIVEYSGDKTCAGTELFKLNKIDKIEENSMYFRLNKFSDYSHEASFRIFIEDGNGSIIYKSELLYFEKLGKRQVTLGYIINGIFYLDVFPENNRIVSYTSSDGKESNLNLGEFLMRKPIFSIESIFDELGLEYRKEKSTDLKEDEKYTIFE